MALNSTKTLRIPTYKSRTKMNTRNTAGLITRKADASALRKKDSAQYATQCGKERIQF